MSEVETRISLQCNDCGSQCISLKSYSAWDEAQGEWLSDGDDEMMCDFCDSNDIEVTDIPIK